MNYIYIFFFLHSLAFADLVLPTLGAAGRFEILNFPQGRYALFELIRVKNSDNSQMIAEFVDEYSKLYAL